MIYFAPGHSLEEYRQSLELWAYSFMWQNRASESAFLIEAFYVVSVIDLVTEFCDK